MELSEFYNKYVKKKDGKKFECLTRKEKENVQMIYRMHEKGLVHLNEFNDR